MGTLLDMIGSIVFGGSLIMITLNANSAARETQDKYAGDMCVQQSLTDVVSGVESEFRNMGFGVADTAATILNATPESITFLSCLDGTGTNVDTIRYWAGATDELLDTQNELDRPLYRTQNGSGRMMVGVVTTFLLKYIDHNKSVLSTPVAAIDLKNIQTIEITIEVQNPYANYREAGTVKSGERNALYSSSLWQQTRLASQNFKR
jgi:hypothetical protein